MDGFDPMQLRQVAILGMLGGSIDADKGQLLMSLADLYAPPQPDINQQKDIQNLQSSMTSLNDIEQMVKSSGQFNPMNIGGKISDTFGGIFANPEREAVKNRIGFYGGQLVKSLAGGNPSDSEREYYMGLLPTVNDTEDVAISKLSAIRKELENKLSGRATNITDLSTIYQQQ